MPGGMSAVEKPTCKDTRKLARERNDPHDPHNEADAREEVRFKNTYELCFLESMLRRNVAFS